MIMKNFTNQIAGAALLALAALPMVALATSANAATTVRVADLDLTTQAGLAAFDQRAAAAARKFCLPKRSPGDKALCREGVREELTEKMAVIRQAQLQRAATYAAR
jgi:UrcA family protein